MASTAMTTAGARLPSVHPVLQFRTRGCFDLLAVELAGLSLVAFQPTPTLVYIVGTREDGSRVAHDRRAEGMIDSERMELEANFSDLISAEVSTFSQLSVSVHNIEVQTGSTADLSDY